MEMNTKRTEPSYIRGRSSRQPYCQTLAASPSFTIIPLGGSSPHRRILILRKNWSNAGRSGVSDGVDYHYGKLAYAVLLSAFMSMGARSYGGNVEGYYPTLRQDIAAGVGADLNRAGQKIVDPQLNVQPTIQVRPGFKFMVMVNKDVVLRPYGNNE